MKGQFTDQFLVFQNTFNDCVDRMRMALIEIRNVANNVTANSADIAQGNNDLNHRTVKQAANLEETAASMEEITTTVEGNEVNSSEANELAKSASAQAKTGGEIVDKAIQAMNGLNESSRKISDIIGVINDIAFQTNLLALNASVEAARAGEQGRGFGDSLAKIVTGVEKVTAIIGHISEASQEQSLGIGSVGSAISKIDELTQQNASLVEQPASASKNLNSQANELTRLVSSFTLGDNVQAIPRVASNSETMEPLRRAQ